MEVKTTAHLIRKLFSCDVDNIPTEVLANDWTFSYAHPKVSREGADISGSGNNYTRCVAALNHDSTKCGSHIEKVCGERFGMTSEKQLVMCQRYLSNPDSIVLNNSVNETIKNDFQQHRTCMTQLRHEIDTTCQSFLMEACQSKSMRVMKVVRASIESMAFLLEIMPTLKIIHLVRDPKPVAISRINFPGKLLIGLKLGNETPELVSEAERYCRTVADDFTVKQNLERRHPGRIYSIIHEDLVKNPKSYMDDIYKFIGEPVPQETYDWLKWESIRRKDYANSSYYPGYTKATDEESEQIRERCTDFYSIVNRRKT